MATENKNSTVIITETSLRGTACCEGTKQKQSAYNKEIASAKELRNDVRVPKLRFKEFDGEWENNEFGELARRSKSKYNPAKETLNLPCIELECLSQETGKLLKYFNSKEQKSIKNRFKEGDILFGKLRPYLKKYLKAPFDGVCSSEIWVLEGIKLNNEYLYQLIQTHKYNLEVNITSGSKMPRAEWEYISSVKFKYPNLQEQQKIATFLTSVDDKIQQLTQKKTLLEQYKKGVMQQIFSQQLRFKPDETKQNDITKKTVIANDSEAISNSKKEQNSLDAKTSFPDWEEKKLGEVCTKKSSNISANTIEENTGDYKIYGASGYLKSIDFFREEKEYISIVKDGAGVGRTLLCDAKSSVLGTLDIIQPKKDINLYFIYSLLNNINFSKYSIGSTIPHIYFKDYSKENIKIPCFEEQQKIANYLSAIDKKIANVQTQIAKTQTFKKGLLQQMFV